MNKTLRRAVATAGLATLALAFTATPAAAHVTVDPDTAEGGSYARLDFRVPNESDSASTVELEVVFPEDHPLASVSVMPVPGWTAEPEIVTLAEPLEVHGREITQAVASITWTADSDEAGVQPGEFMEFPVSAGPLPDSGTLVFKALQTYSDDEIVRWIEEPVEGQEEPASPAPVLEITPSTEMLPETDDAAATDGGQAGTEATTDDSDSDPAAIIAAIAAGAVAVVALAVAVVALRSRPKSSTPSDT